MLPITESTSSILESKTASLQIIYTEPETLVITQPGKHHDGSATAKEPTFTVKKSALSSSSSTGGGGDQKYILLAIDLDAPYVSLSMLGPLVHLIIPDLVVSPSASSSSSSTTSGADGDYTSLIPSSTSPGPMISYIGPNAPPLAADHRYVFLLYEQPASFDRDAVLEACQLPTGGPDKIGLTSRVKFDQRAFEEAAGVGRAVAGNWFGSK